MVCVVQDFFITSSLYPRLNSNLVALIPKIVNDVKVEHFRPIAMGNFVFKLITQIIADRLGSIVINFFHQTNLDLLKVVMGVKLLWALLSVFCNGQPEGYFGCSRGVRQGDPLSPLLFVLAEDFLSRLLTSLNVSGKKLNAISSSHNVNAPTQFLFADDVLLFSKATMPNLKTILEAFKMYGLLSGQLVNWDKPLFILGLELALGCVLECCSFWK